MKSKVKKVFFLLFPHLLESKAAGPTCSQMMGFLSAPTPTPCRIDQLLVPD